MKKRSRKLVSILLTLSLLAALLLPMAAPAAAAGTYSAITAPTVSDEGDTALGKIKVTWEKTDVTGAQELFFRLPTDFKYFPDAVSRTNVVEGVGASVYLGTAGGATKYVEVTVPGTSALEITDLAITKITDNEFKISYDGTYGAGSDDPVFYVDFKSAYVPAYEGDITVTIDTPNGSALSDGSVVIGKTTGGAVEVSVIDTDTGNSDFNVTLRIKENVTGALSNEADSIKFILPDGYQWKSAPFVSKTQIWGDNLTITAADFTVDEEELSFNPGEESATQATCFEVVLQFEVVDENDVKAVDFSATVKGESTVSPSSIVVGTYGDYSSTVKAVDADDLPTVYAGKVEQAISNIVIKESIKESLSDNRYIKLELPSFARWTTVPNIVSDSGVTLTFAGVSGSEGNIVKYTVSGPSTSAAELEFEDMEVLLDVTAPGDLKVKVTGNAGVEGEIAVAKIASTVTVKAETKPEVKIGMAAQKVGDITITEAKAGAIADGKSLVLKVPAGNEFSKLPKVEVISGDLKLDTTQIKRAKTVSTTQPTDYYQYLVIPVDNDSNEASTIKISEIYVSIDRTVAEGDLKVAVLGSAILESNGTPAASWFASATAGDINGAGGADYTATSSLFPATAALTAVPVAVVGTPAPGETKANAAFVIGSTTFKLNGVDTTMDAAPYIKDGRTYLPLRYVAQSLGVADANILWDGATKKVTLIKGTTFVQLTIGSNILMVNGMPITMDVAPEITSDRTCLPIRFVAQVLGATVGWDEATQTVTLK